MGYRLEPQVCMWWDFTMYANPVLMAESERKFWQVVKAGFPDSYKVVIP